MCWQAVAPVGVASLSLRLGARATPLQAQLDGFKSRLLTAAARVDDERRWHYEIEWSHASSVPSSPVLEAFQLLAVGNAPQEWSSSRYAIQRPGATHSNATSESAHFHAVIFVAALQLDSVTQSPNELRVMDITLHVLQAMSDQGAPPVWIYTASTQPISCARAPAHAGLWGLGRACRQERATLPVWCVDACDGGAGSMSMLIREHTVRLANGCVRGLQTSASMEPESACSVATTLYVPRMVAPYAVMPGMLDLGFTSLCHLLEAHVSDACAALDINGKLQRAYVSFETLCQQYLQAAVHALPQSTTFVWHHKLLHAWCAKQRSHLPGSYVAPADVSTAYPELWAEVNLAKRCGSRFADALSGAVAYQELLFPGGSMEVVLPVYEQAIGAAFYNGCVVAAVGTILSLLPNGRAMTALEVGAGSGGTASSVLSFIKSACKRYVFTDVSEVFLRQARVRFADFPFLEYALLNIDADPRLQGFAAGQCDVIISTNCLHATPFMVNTMRHCEQLLCEGGMVVVNDSNATAAFVQMTFGMTDGWWLFAECRDPERVGQDIPLLNWRQWEALLVDSGFRETHCMMGDGFLRGQAVIVGQAITLPTDAARVTLEGGACLVSGGLGGLGLLTARQLVEGGVEQLVLSSRSDRVVAGSEEDWVWLAECGAEVRRVRCDASDEGAVSAIAGSLSGDGVLFSGLFHAAHALADGLLANQHALNFRTTYGPKIHGATALHAALWYAPLRFFNVFSSIAGLMGAAGQAPHSAANAWLDTFGGWRRQLGVSGQSVNWGAVAEIGYAARHGADCKAEAGGAGAISRAMALAALSSTLHPACRRFAVLPANWSKLLAGSSEALGYLAPYFHLRGCATAQAEGACTIQEQMLPVVAAAAAAASTVELDAVLEMVKRTAGGFVDADAPLMEAGVDSLGAVELRNQLQGAAGKDVTLPSTLVFDHPTARGLYLFLSPSTPVEARAIAPDSAYQQLAPSDISLLSTRETLPRGVPLWTMAANAFDAASQVPHIRWNAVAGARDVEQRCRFASYMVGLEYIDHRAFNLSVAEVSAMDPQQRLLLEHSYAVNHTAGSRRQELLGSGMGVFVGITTTEFAQVEKPASVYDVGGVGHCFAAGRVSYVLGLQGPAVAVDVACSSSLVAGHSAVRALQHDEAAVAVLAGVHAMLVPSLTLLYAQGGLTSKRGRSHTFDKRADGFGRGEACGACLLSADLRLRNPPQLAGSAVRQDGKSASLTAPNGQAQQALLDAACADASLKVLHSVEAHGTGTTLGDPIEVGAFAAFSRGLGDAESTSLGVGSAKANMGHAEPAAGMVGMLKLSSFLGRLQLAPNAQLRVLSPYLRERLCGLACGLPTQLAANSGENGITVGGVSSFGLGGTIAHTVLAFGRCEDLGSCTAELSAKAKLLYRRQSFQWRAVASSVKKRTRMYAACWTPAPLTLASPRGEFLLVATGCSAQRSLPSWQPVTVLLAMPSAVSTAPSLHNTQVALVLTQRLLARMQLPRLVILTLGVLACGGVTSNAAHGGAVGLARVLRLEHPTLAIQSVCNCLHGASVVSPHALTALPSEEEAAWCGAAHLVARLRACASCEPAVARDRVFQGQYTLTGGLGGLGMRAAALLVDGGAVALLLASRSGRIARDGGHETELQLRRSMGALASVVPCDSADTCDTSALLSNPLLSGWLHAAGVGDKGLLAELELRRMQWMHASKAVGVWHLHSASVTTPHRTRVLFSSVGAGLGNVGQANYAAANAYLDAHGSSQRGVGAVACSVQWPLVGGAGMGADAYAAITTGSRQIAIAGLAGISLEEYAACLDALVGACGALALSVQLAHLSERELLQDLSDATQLRFAELVSFDEATPVPSDAPSMETPSAHAILPSTLAEMQAAVLRVVGELTGACTAVPIEASLSDLIDSLAATELSSRLQHLLGMQLPPTLVFDHPTPLALATHLLYRVQQMSAPPGSSLHTKKRPSEQWVAHETPAGTDASILLPAHSPVSCRVLFLHGQGTSAKIALALLRMRGWFDEMPFEFVIPDGTHRVEAFTDEATIDNLGLSSLQSAGLYDPSEPQRMWAARFDKFIKNFAAANGYLPDENGRVFVPNIDGSEMVNVDEIIKEQGSTSSSPEMWAETVEYLRGIIAAYGPFDAIGGFSEGAATAHNLLQLQASGVDVGLGGVKLCLAFSPWISPLSEVSHRLTPRLLLTSGRQDLAWFHHACSLFMEDFADTCMHEFDGEHVYPLVSTTLRRLCWDMVSTQRIDDLRYNALQVDGELVSPCLSKLCAKSDRPALFAIPDARGQTGAYAGLAPVLDVSVYSAIHPHLHTGLDLEATALGELAEMWARSIVSEMDTIVMSEEGADSAYPLITAKAAVGRYVLLGASLGGVLAHLVTQSAAQRGHPPHGMVLLDPAPLSAVVKQPRFGFVRRAAAFLALHTITGFEPESFKETSNEWELGCMLAASRVDRGQPRTCFTARAVIACVRELSVATHLLGLTARFQAHSANTTDDVLWELKTLLVSTTVRENEFAGEDLALLQAVADVARHQFQPSEELVLVGTYSEVIMRCANGRDEAFNAMLRRMLLEDVAHIWPL